MSESITVVWRTVSADGNIGLGHHMFLIYTNSAGFQQAISGFPSSNGGILFNTSGTLDVDIGAWG